MVDDDSERVTLPIHLPDMDAHSERPSTEVEPCVESVEGAEKHGGHEQHEALLEEVGRLQADEVNSMMQVFSNQQTEAQANENRLVKMIEQLTASVASAEAERESARADCLRKEVAEHREHQAIELRAKAEFSTLQAEFSTLQASITVYYHL